MKVPLPRAVASAAVVVAATLAVPLWGSTESSTSRGDLVASAHASAGVPSPTDERSAVVRLRDKGRARSTATSSATCDGCHGVASTVEVVYARRGAVVDNVAAAWASCTGCGARALAVQVVVVSGRGRVDVVATNRALAVNAVCVTCTTDALAVQYVIVGGHGRQMSKRVRAELEALAAELAKDPAGATKGAGPSTQSLRSTGPKPRTSPALDRLTAELAADLGGSVTLHLDRRQG